MNINILARLLVQRPKTVLLVFTIFTIIIGIQARNIYMESDFSTYLPPDDPTIQLFNRIDSEFHIGSTIIIYVEASGAYDLRDPAILNEIDYVSCHPFLNKYTDDNGLLDGVSSVTSIASLIKGENAKQPIPGGLGGTGIAEIPSNKDLIARYIARTSVQGMKGTLFTNDYRVAIISLQLADDADFDTILENVNYVIDHKGTDYTQMTVTGTIAMQKAIQRYSMSNLAIVFPLAILFVSVVLFFFHRSIKGIIIAFLPPAYAITLTFGFLGIFQPELTIISISIVALLMGLGVDYSIHLVNRFAEEHSIESKIQRMEKTLQSTGKAVLLSTITTMIGFGSLMISSMSPMVTFGFGCAIGILCCFISAILLVPCLALMLNFENNGGVRGWKQFSHFAIRNRKRIVIVACFFAVLSLIVVPEIATDVNYFDLAPKGLPEVEAITKYSEAFGSGTNFNALLVVTDINGLTYPNVIDAIYDLEEEIRSVNKNIVVYSIADELKNLHDILERNTIISTLSESLGVEKIILDRVAKGGLIDEEFSKTLIIISIPVGLSIEELETLVNSVNMIVTRANIPHNGQISQLTGQDAVTVAINKLLMNQQTRSMIIALLLVLAALIIIFSSTQYGFLTMIPVFFVLMWEPGFLILLDIPLSVVTISIASIMVGIGIDYGVHITQRVREGLAQGLSNIEAITVAIERTGLSLVEAASTTVAGILSIYFVNIPAIQEFGWVIILMTVSSCIGAALLLPLFFELKIGKKRGR